MLWVYFTFGFLFGYAPRYLVAWLANRHCEAAFQGLNQTFLSGFFRFLQRVIPGTRIKIAPAVSRIRGAVIICNHLSYLDPILLIAQFPKQKTIVKGTFFRMPIFGWFLTAAGYLPAAAKGAQVHRMLDQIENMKVFLASGGNLFVFPEGTRLPEQTMGQLGKGAFRIARRCVAPIEILHIQNTHQLFPPGRFRFNTCRPVQIELKRLGRLGPYAAGQVPPVSVLMREVRELYEFHNR